MTDVFLGTVNLAHLRRFKGPLEGCERYTYRWHTPSFTTPFFPPSPFFPRPNAMSAILLNIKRAYALPICPKRGNLNIAFNLTSIHYCEILRI
jgi:hypothetical protein